jgi:hypothetical protein
MTTNASRAANDTFTVTGALRRGGEPFTAIGVNYHPAESGCEPLRRWDPDRRAADFRAMAAHGCNTVRFFVPWREVEPAAGRYDATALERLRQLAQLAADAGLRCIPALLTIFMNGELLDLPWRAGRDLWTDATMRERSRAYVGRVAAALRPVGNVLAYDLGDELVHVAPEAAGQLTRVAAAEWLAELAAAVRAADPGALVMQANESSAVFGAHPFGPDNAAPLDLLGLHGFPLWSAPAIESTASFKATLLPSFLAAFGAVFGRPLTDELGAYAVSPEIAAGYLRAAGHSALAAGSAGVLAWCWQDIASDRPPYDRHPQERLVGLLDGAGRPKPALAELETLSRRAAEWSGLAPAPAPVAVLLPELWRPRPSSYLERPGSWPIAAFYAYLLAKRGHLPIEFTAAARPHHRLLICPSVERLTIADNHRLAAFVAGGGAVLCSSGRVLDGLGEVGLFGLRPRDFDLDSAAQSGFDWAGAEYPIDWGAGARLPVLEAAGADVLASYPNGGVALSRSRHGEGAAFYLNAPFERQLDSPGRLESRPWHRLYEAIAAAAGIVREIDCDSPAVETQVLAGAGVRLAVLVNHSAAPVSATATAIDAGGERRRRLELGPKGVATWSLGGDCALNSG